MLFWSVMGFVAGCCIGANSIEDTLQSQSVAVAIIMLPLFGFLAPFSYSYDGERPSVIQPHSLLYS